MEILGIGATELVFILLIAIIVLGPKEMQNAGKTVGRWLNRLVHSEGWKTFQDTTRALRSLPNRLMREANMEVWEAQQDIRRAIDPQAKPSASPRRQGLSLPEEPENSIQPPSSDSSEQSPATHAATPPDKDE